MHSSTKTTRTGIDGSIESGTALTPQTYPDHQRGKGQDKWPTFS
jgi:hypothetical protein